MEETYPIEELTGMVGEWFTFIHHEHRARKEGTVPQLEEIDSEARCLIRRMLRQPELRGESPHRATVVQKGHRDQVGSEEAAANKYQRKKPLHITRAVPCDPPKRLVSQGPLHDLSPPVQVAKGRSVQVLQEGIPLSGTTSERVDRQGVG